MDEIRNVLKKYDAAYVQQGLSTLQEINKFAYVFARDVAELYDAITRVRNLSRNPTGFSLDDAPILGLLVRVWKLQKEVIRYYEADNAEIIGILERPMLEASIVAEYLLKSDAGVIHDYRKCSYKDRLRILQDLERGSRFYETKAGKRLLASVRRKMSNEDLRQDDFELQRRNRWKIQGKSFFEIFSEVEQPDLYAVTYGMMSESIHGSWNESMDWCLQRNEDGTFSTFPFHHPADVRYIAPLIRFTVRPFRLWLERVDIANDLLVDALKWVEDVNTALFRKFDESYDG